MAKTIEDLMKDDKHYRMAFEVRSGEESKDDKGEEFVTLQGKPVSIGEDTVLFKDMDGNDVHEVMEPGVLDKSDMSDVVFNVNHDESMIPAARTRNKSLTLEKKDDGLYMKCRINKKNENGMRLYEAIREGLLDRMSFAFTIRKGGYDFDEKTNTFHVRDIDKLYDVSAVSFPAYANTSISARFQQDVDTFHAEALERAKKEAEAKTEEDLKLARAKAMAGIN